MIVVEVWMVGWLLLIMIGFKYRNSHLHLSNFNFETLKIIKKGYQNFLHLPGHLWPHNNKKDIMLLSHFIISCMYIMSFVYCCPLFLHISFISHFLSSGNSYCFIFWMLQKLSYNCTYFRIDITIDSFSST